MSKVNENWHKNNPIPQKVTINQRIQWHVDHQRECGCRPIPPLIQTKMLERKPKLVVGVLVRYNNMFLLAKETLEGGKNYWIIPGGKVEFGETIEQAAKREIHEETGIKTKSLKFLSYKEAIAPKYNYHTVIFFFETMTKNQKIKGDIEGKVIEARWFTKENALKLPLVFSAKWLFTEII